VRRSSGQRQTVGGASLAAIFVQRLVVEPDLALLNSGSQSGPTGPQGCIVLPAPLGPKRRNFASWNVKADALHDNKLSP